MIIQPILGYPCLPTFGAQFDYWAGLIDGRLWIPSPQIIIGEDRTKLARLIGGIVVQMPKPAGLQNVADEDYVGYLHEIYKKAFEYKDWISHEIAYLGSAPVGIPTRFLRT
jgi:hypothetical protein